MVTKVMFSSWDMYFAPNAKEILRLFEGFETEMKILDFSEYDSEYATLEIEEMFIDLDDANEASACIVFDYNYEYVRLEYTTGFGIIEANKLKRLLR